MNKNLWMVVLAIGLVAVSAVVVRQRQEIAELNDRPAPPIVTQIVKVAMSRAPAREKPAPPPAPEPPESMIAPPEPAPANKMMSGLAGMMKDPQFKEIIRAQQKMMIDKMFGSLGKYLPLEANQSEALKSLLLDRQTALTEAGLAMMNGGGTDPKVTVAIKADYDAKIQALLGPQNYQVFQDFEATQPERMQVEMFKGQLPSADALMDQQEEDLIAALYQQRKTLPDAAVLQNQTPDPAKFTEDGMANMLKVAEQLQKQYAEAATTVLTPSQMEQFTKYQTQMQAMQAASMKMAAQMFATKPAPVAPASAP